MYHYARVLVVLLQDARWHVGLQHCVIGHSLHACVSVKYSPAVASLGALTGDMLSAGAVPASIVPPVELQPRRYRK
jgi:hypothetical protein